MRKYLSEGLREHDLDKLVIPLVSIDEFESKVDDDLIVIGFFVKDSDPADDLNRFIQKSPVSLVDTEVSPAPNQDGYFVVFVEVMRDPSFYSKLTTILDEIENLVGIAPEDWSFSCYGHDGIFQLTEEKVKVLIRTESIEDLKQKAFDDELLEFFKPSVLDNVQLDENLLSLFRGSNKITSEIVSFGPTDIVEEAYLGEAVNLSDEANRLCRRWENMLGEGWMVHLIGEHAFISSAYDTNVLVLKNLA